jgi:tripartite-type tricarboxylate transporter receptor subunit TctC
LRLAPSNAAAIAAKLNTEIATILKLPEVRPAARRRLELVGNTPEQFGDFIKSEIVKWGKVIKAAGIRAE